MIRVIDLAVARAEIVGECGWDQRLCFGDDEIADFGVDVMQSYEAFKEEGGNGNAMQVDGTDGCAMTRRPHVSAAVPNSVSSGTY